MAESRRVVAPVLRNAEGSNPSLPTEIEARRVPGWSD